MKIPVIKMNQKWGRPKAVKSISADVTVFLEKGLIQNVAGKRMNQKHTH